MSRLLIIILVGGLAGIAGCSCSSIPESPPSPGPTIELRHDKTVSPDGSEGAGTKLDQPVTPLPPRK